MEIDKISLGKRIKNIRLMHGYTMAEFGEIVGGANQSLVAKWENGKSIPKPDRLAILIQLSGLDEHSLLHGIEPYELPSHIQQKLNDTELTQFFDVNSYEEFLSLSKKFNIENPEKTFNEIQLLKQIALNKKHADHLYELEQQEKMKEEKTSSFSSKDIPQVNLPSSGVNLEAILNSKTPVYFKGTLLDKEHKQMVYEILNPIFNLINKKDK